MFILVKLIFFCIKYNFKVNENMNAKKYFTSSMSFKSLKILQIIIK